MTSDPFDKAASIHLEYGADSADFDFGDLHICPKGLSIKTRWYFEPGAELSVNFQIDDGSRDGGGGGRLLKTEGIVAACEPDGTGNGYEVTVVFVEVTDDILAVIRDVAGVTAILPG